MLDHFPTLCNKALRPKHTTCHVRIVLYHEFEWIKKTAIWKEMNISDMLSWFFVTLTLILMEISIINIFYELDFLPVFKQLERNFVYVSSTCIVVQLDAWTICHVVLSIVSFSATAYYQICIHFDLLSYNLECHVSFKVNQTSRKSARK